MIAFDVDRPLRGSPLQVALLQRLTALNESSQLPPNQSFTVLSTHALSQVHHATLDSSFSIQHLAALPPWLTNLADTIYLLLPPADARGFLLEFWQRVPAGGDMDRLKIPMLKWLVGSPQWGIVTYAEGQRATAAQTLTNLFSRVGTANPPSAAEFQAVKTTVWERVQDIPDRETLERALQDPILKALQGEPGAAARGIARESSLKATAQRAKTNPNNLDEYQRSVSTAWGRACRDELYRLLFEEQQRSRV